jgi:hypothetical protein
VSDEDGTADYVETHVIISVKVQKYFGVRSGGIYDIFLNCSWVDTQWQ